MSPLVAIKMNRTSSVPHLALQGYQFGGQGDNVPRAVRMRPTSGKSNASSWDSGTSLPSLGPRSAGPRSQGRSRSRGSADLERRFARRNLSEGPRINRSSLLRQKIHHPTPQEENLRVRTSQVRKSDVGPIVPNLNSVKNSARERHQPSMWERTESPKTPPARKNPGSVYDFLESPPSTRPSGGYRGRERNHNANPVPQLPLSDSKREDALEREDAAENNNFLDIYEHHNNFEPSLETYSPRTKHNAATKIQKTLRGYLRRKEELNGFRAETSEVEKLEDLEMGSPNLYDTEEIRSLSSIHTDIQEKDPLDQLFSSNPRPAVKKFGMETVRSDISTDNRVGSEENRSGVSSKMSQNTKVIPYKSNGERQDSLNSLLRSETPDRRGLVNGRNINSAGYNDMHDPRQAQEPPPMPEVPPSDDSSLKESIESNYSSETSYLIDPSENGGEKFDAEPSEYQEGQLNCVEFHSICTGFLRDVKETASNLLLVQPQCSNISLPRQSAVPKSFSKPEKPPLDAETQTEGRRNSATFLDPGYLEIKTELDSLQNLVQELRDRLLHETAERKMIEEILTAREAEIRLLLEREEKAAAEEGSMGRDLTGLFESKMSALERENSQLRAALERVGNEPT